MLPHCSYCGTLQSLHRLRGLGNAISGTLRSASGFQCHAGVVAEGITYKQADRGRFLHQFCTSTHSHPGTKRQDVSVNGSQHYCCVILVAFTFHVFDLSV